MDVFLDPRLPDYYSERSWQQVRQRQQGPDSAFGDFLQQRLGVVHGFSLAALDRDFLANLSFPQTWEFKKLQVAGLATATDTPTAAMVLRDGFHGDQGAYRHFVTQVQALKGICDELLAAILPFTPPVVNLLTRFSETRLENLHFDLDAAADDHEAFRLYINLDRAPRLWATSYQMTELVRQGGQRLCHGVSESMPGEAILKRIATRAFGGWNQRATERIAPRHLVYVDPGDVFFVDGRGISHQVVTGHRVFTVYAKIPHAGHPEVQPTFASKLRGALAAAQQVPPGRETALVDYYEPAQVTAAPHVREQWNEVFGDTRSGRIRRFDDGGLRGGSGPQPC